ncbi:hypothetical protein BsWGS_27228 [Bradybaena similaris]
MSSHVPLRTPEGNSLQPVGYFCDNQGSMVLLEKRQTNVKQKIRRRTKRWLAGIRELDFDAVALFCEYTSAHGFRCSTSRERNRIIRTLWKIAIVVSLTLMVWGLIQLGGNYCSYPVKTLLDVKYVSALPFPAVTLCNLHRFDYSKANLLQNVTNAAEKLYNIHLAESITSEKDLDDWLSDPSYGDVLEQPVSTLYNLLANNISKTFNYCAWNGVKVACESIFQLVQTIDGMCYQFNHNTSNPVSTSMIGPSSGLSVSLTQTVPQGDSMMASGLKVLLDEPGSYQDMVNRGFKVPLGFSTFGRIFMRQAIHLKYPYKSYGDKYCTTSAAGYNRDSCVASCAHQTASRVCNCTMDQRDGTRSQKAQCTLRQALACIRPTFAKALLEASANNNSCGSCEYICSVTTYSMTTSHASFAPDAGHRSNNLELRLFYDHMIKEEIIYEPVYTWHSILGIFGGYMGLFIGASVLTICEAIECACLTVYQTFKRVSSRNRKQTQPTTPQVEINSD